MGKRGKKPFAWRNLDQGVSSWPTLAQTSPDLGRHASKWSWKGANLTQGRVEYLDLKLRASQCESGVSFLFLARFLESECVERLASFFEARNASLGRAAYQESHSMHGADSSLRLGGCIA